MSRVPREETTETILQDLRRRVRDLEAKQQVAHAAVEEGALRVVDATTGRLILWAGQAENPLYDRPDGTKQSGVWIYRDTGEMALAMSDPNPGSLYQQYIGLNDRNGNVVISDDTESGWGFARPWIPTGPWFTNVMGNWPAYNEPEFGTVWRCWVTLQQPYLDVAVQGVATAGTVGEMRVLLDGDVVLGPATITGGIGGGDEPDAYLFDGLRIEGQPYGASVWVELQCRRTSGSGNVRTSPYWCFGRQTQLSD